MIYGTDVVSTDGTVRKVRDALAVPSGFAAVAVLRELRPGRPIRDEGAKAALRPFAVALRGWLGPGDEESLTLQGAGTKLRGLEGFAEAMVEQRITGIGALMRFLELFPEFEVIGQHRRQALDSGRRESGEQMRSKTLEIFCVLIYQTSVCCDAS